MRFIVYYEFCPEDFDKVITKMRKLQEERKKYPGKYPKTLFPPQVTGYCKGFTLFDVENEEQRARIGMHYFPELKLKWVPISNSSDIIELYLKMEK